MQPEAKLERPIVWRGIELIGEPVPPTPEQVDQFLTILEGIARRVSSEEARDAKEVKSWDH